MGDNTSELQTRIDQLTEQLRTCNDLADQAAFLLGDRIERLTRRLQDRERDEDAQQSA